MKNPRSIILEPVVSEKAYRLAEEENTYVFKVHPSATKPEIEDAVKAIWGVEPIRVNTARRRGKRVFDRRRGRWGRRPGEKRAFVTLPEGSTIDVYGGV
ncbi:MAG: hypothetical protein KatS3mg008_1116 [Acidimicrobiales bacterium]|nr:MAG: hypothetical protein KatS3mg008_1116 [Acidimicrobiales bacterium]